MLIPSVIKTPWMARFQSFSQCLFCKIKTPLAAMMPNKAVEAPHAPAGESANESALPVMPASK